MKSDINKHSHIMLKNKAKYYLIYGALALSAGILLAYYAAIAQTHATPPPHFQANPLVHSFSQHSTTTLDGQLKLQHPLILLPELAELTSTARVALFQQRYRHYQQKNITAYPRPCNQAQLSALTVCWLTTNNPHTFKLALNMLVNLAVEKPNASSRYGNGWQLALNYDLLAASSNITSDQHQQIQTKLQSLLVDYLKLLDDSSASLWHGRLSLASNAWLCAAMLDASSDKQRQLIIRAQHYFLQSAQSAAITEAWPEGYNYWINNRAFVFVLAGTAYINALENSVQSGNIKQLLERIGLWHIYATRPDNKIEGFGDEGPRVDLKDDTRRVIDLIASTTGNQQLAQYSLYLQKLHGAASYYRRYRWGFPLFNNPELLPAHATGELAQLASTLPISELFGRHASNTLYLRSSWQPDATFLSYRAGHNFTHHGHYDAGHFTLFKGQSLVVNSSNYGDYKGSNHLNYSIRTLAKNSLVIQRPNETVKPNQFFKENIAAGGQRITLPTGSAIRSPQHWRDNLYQGQHLAAAELEQFTSTDEYSYIQSDLTAAYNNSRYDENNEGGKVQRVQRALLYLNREDILLVHDRINTTDPAYRAKWLLHSLNKPRVANEQTLAGSKDNGIIRSISQQSLIQEKNSSLKVTILLPQNASQHLVGGKDYRYYVETDSDDTELNGTNMDAGSNEKPWFEAANWRTEIFSSTPQREQRFLIALAPAINAQHPITAKPLHISDKQIYGALLASSAVIFTQNQRPFSVDLPAAVKRLYLIAESQQPKRILLNGKPLPATQQHDIITEIQLPDTAVDKSLHIEL
jgi:Heparinase II/III-like protein